MKILLELMLTMARKNMVTDEEWERQGRLYELGVKHGTEIAMDLGVSPQTVYREMQERGIKKAALVHLNTAALENYLDRKANHRALEKISQTERKWRAQHSRMMAIDHMMNEIIKAHQAGDLTLANPVIELVGEAVGARIHGKRRKA